MLTVTNTSILNGICKRLKQSSSHEILQPGVVLRSPQHNAEMSKIDNFAYVSPLTGTSTFAGKI